MFRKIEQGRLSHTERTEEQSKSLFVKLWFSYGLFGRPLLHQHYLELVLSMCPHTHTHIFIYIYIYILFQVL